MSHSQFHSTDLFILRHAWLNLWDKHMTTGRINQVSYKQLTRKQALNQKRCSLGTLTKPFSLVRFIARVLYSLPSRETRNKFPDSLEQYQALGKNTQVYSLLVYWLAKTNSIRDTLVLHRVYEYTFHDQSEARDFISSRLSCSVRSLGISQSKDIQLVSHFTKSQKSIQILIDFNPTKFDLIRILSFARFQPKLSSYISGACGSLGITVLRVSISIYGKCSKIVAPVNQFKNWNPKFTSLHSSMNNFKISINSIS